MPQGTPVKSGELPPDALVVDPWGRALGHPQETTLFVDFNNFCFKDSLYPFTINYNSAQDRSLEDSINDLIEQGEEILDSYEQAIDSSANKDQLIQLHENHLQKKLIFPTNDLLERNHQLQDLYEEKLNEFKILNEYQKKIKTIFSKNELKELQSNYKNRPSSEFFLEKLNEYSKEQESQIEADEKNFQSFVSQLIHIETHEKLIDLKNTYHKKIQNTLNPQLKEEYETASNAVGVKIPDKSGYVAKFVASYLEHLKKDLKGWVGIFRKHFGKSNIDINNPHLNLKTILEHAEKDGGRTKKVLKEIGWLQRDGKIRKDIVQMSNRESAIKPLDNISSRKRFEEFKKLNSNIKDNSKKEEHNLSQPVNFQKK